MPTETMSEQVPAAAAPATPEVSTVTLPGGGSDQSWADTMKTWTPDQQAKWAMTGEEPTVEPKAKDVTTEPQKSPAAKAEPGPDAGTGDKTTIDDDHPFPDDAYASPEARKKAGKAFADIKRSRTALRRENELLKAQLAEKPTGAAPVESQQVKAPTRSKLEPPKRPSLGDFEELTAYEAAMEQYESQRDVYREAVSMQKQKEQRHQSVIDAAIALGESQNPEFDAESFMQGTKASWPMLSALVEHKDGAALLLYLGQHPEEAAELAAETEIPVEAKSLLAAMDEIDADPRLARAFGRAEAIVNRKLAEIAGTLKGKQASQKPITQTRAPIPGTRVAPTVAAPSDPIQAAYERGDYGLGARLEFERDLAEIRRR